MCVMTPRERSHQMVKRDIKEHFNSVHNDLVKAEQLVIQQYEALSKKATE